MRAGRLRHRCVIEERDQGQDEYGELVDRYRPIAEISCEADYQKAEEDQIAGIEAGEIVMQFVMRYRDWITDNHYITYKGERYTITGVIPDLKRRELTVMAFRIEK